jgi:DNA-binding GntR family transcriptional regulator
MSAIEIDDTESSVASHRIADQLRMRILKSDLMPGSRLLQEQVAAELGASRVPVREAFRILESEGLVMLKTNSGAWVSKLDMHECQAVYRVREKVEPLVLAESMPNLTSSHHEQLEAIQAEIETDFDVDRFLSLDRRLHLLTYSGCTVDSLNVMVERFWNSTQHYRRAFMRLTFPNRLWVVTSEHRLLIDAIIRNDVEGAGGILSAHIRRTRVQLANHPELFET